MTEQKEFLAKIILALEASGVEYMLSGSIASSFHGQPRATNDIDLVVAISESQLADLENLLDQTFYISSNAARNALSNQTAFNIIDPKTGWKADLIIRKSRPHSLEEFRRRMPVQAMGLKIYIVSPEDAILSKLEWAKDSGSERQWRDALGVAIAQLDKLDREYMEKWARELAVLDRLSRLLDQASEFNPS